MSSNQSKFSTRSVIATVVVGAALMTLSAIPAEAHVTVSSTNATQGGWGTLVFKIPTESDTASTVKVAVAIPQDTPLAYVSYQPVPGWTTQVTKSKLAKPVTTDDGTLTEGVSSITWTAIPSASIKPGQFQQFPISAGPLPSQSEISFVATQTYSDGKVVKWNQPTPAGGPEPEYPAPTLELTAAEASDSSGESAAATTTTQTSTSPWTIAALVVAIGALVVGVIALARGKRN